MSKERGGIDFISPDESRMTGAELVNADTTQQMLESGALAHWAPYDRFGRLVGGTLYAHTNEGFAAAKTVAERAGGEAICMEDNGYYENGWGARTIRHTHPDHPNDMEKDFRI